VYFFSEAKILAFSAIAFPAGATHFAPAFKAGARVQTKSPSGLFEKVY